MTKLLAGPVEPGLRSLYAYRTEALLTDGLNRTHLLSGGVEIIHLCMYHQNIILQTSLIISSHM